MEELDVDELSPFHTEQLRSLATDSFDVPPHLQSPAGKRNVNAPPGLDSTGKGDTNTPPKLDRTKLTVTGEFFKYFEDEMPSRTCNVIAVITLEGSITKSDLDALCQERLGSLPRLCSKVVKDEKGTYLFERMPPSWAVADNIHEESLEGGVAGAMKRAEQLFLAPFDDDKPRWEMRILHGGWFTTESVLIFRCSHVIGDGSSLVMTLLALTDDAPGDGSVNAPAPSKNRVEPSCCSGVRKACTCLPSCFAALQSMFCAPSDDATLLQAPCGGVNSMVKQFSTFKVPLAKVKEISKDGATVNDVAVAAIAGGVRRYLLQHKDPAMLSAEEKGVDYPKLSTSIVVGLSVKPQFLMNGSPDPRQIKLQNNIALMTMPLPMFKSADERIGCVVKESMRLKQTLVPQCVGWMLPCLMKSIGARGIADMAMKANEIPKRTCNSSNVPGPQRQLLIAGAKVKNINFYNNPGEALFACVLFSYNSRLNIMLTCHPEFIDGASISRCMQDEWFALLGVRPEGVLA